jgi:hypothetical protein
MDGASSFSLQKGDDVCLPPGCNVLTIGLGWECRRQNLDLDAAILAMSDVDGDGVMDVTHVVNYKNLRESFSNLRDGSGRMRGSHAPGGLCCDQATMRLFEAILFHVRSILCGLTSESTVRTGPSFLIKMHAKRGNFCIFY